VAPQRFTDLDLEDRLLIVDRGMSWLTEHLDALSDDDFDGDSLLAGWQRRHVIAHIGYNADGMVRLADWAATGVETAMYPSAQARADEIELGAHAVPAELRSFVAASAAKLAGKWHSLPASAWRATVRTVAGDAMPATTTVWMRTKELWIHTVDLATGGSFAEFPDEVLAQLLADIDNAWRGNPPRPVGPAAGVVRWATGRGLSELEADPGFEPPAWM
jgi:maleylpyruvate isomerase